MATNTSGYLGLHLWEPNDQVLREEFNENWEKIDGETAGIRTELVQKLGAVSAELGSGGKNCRIAFGSYAGNGQFGSANPNTLNFDFTPMLVVIRANAQRYSGILIRGCSAGGCCWSDGYSVNVSWSEHGVSWYNASGSEYQNNATGYTYYYIALGYSD